MRLPAPRLAAVAVVAALVLPACADTAALEALAPRVFYGFPSRVEGDLLCVHDAREEDPRQERCFQFTQEAVQGLEGLQRGDVIKIRYEPAEGEGQPDRAVDISAVNPRR